jgi:Cu2+-exporting ATPase
MLARDRYASFPIVHHLPGRIRFRVLAVSQNAKYAEQLKTRLDSEPGVARSRLNRACASVTIIYCPRILPKERAVSYLSAILQQPAPQEATKPPPAASDEDEGQWSSLGLPLLAVLLALGSSKFRWLGWRIAVRTVLGLAAFPTVKRAFASIWQEQRLNIDCLDFLALSLSAVQGKLMTPALVICLHELGDLLRQQTARSTAIHTASLLDAIGHYAWVERSGEVVQIDSASVEVGETVVVYPGEQIPVDGEVLQGSATVDCQKLTGESMPIVATVGTTVYASTLVRSGQIRLRADRVGKNTRAAASLALLRQAPVYDTRMANYAAQLADRLVVPALLLATVVGMASRDPARAAAILTLDFVTGIRVSLPTAFLGALNHTTRHGVLVRSGRTLEQLAQVDTIVFDKTGTLTTGEITIVGAIALPDRIDENRLLQLAAAAEQRITHPVAEAICARAIAQGLTLPHRDEWDYQVGLGIRAFIEGQQVWVGSGQFLSQAGIDLAAIERLGDMASAQRSCIYVACDGQLQGAIAYADPLRPQSPALIQKLMAQGLEVHLLTGDSRDRAREVAQLLHIPPTQVYAEAFPERKAAVVRELRRAGKTVAFVGDGLNDAVALAYADVSISFESGSEVARETADVVLMTDNLDSLLETARIARETQRLLEQNTMLVIAPNLAALGLAATVGLNPLWATAIHNGSAIAAGLNSLRPLMQHQWEGRFFKP